MTPSDVRRGGNTRPRVMIVSASGSIKYRRRRNNVGMPLSGQKVRVTEAKDFGTVHLPEDGRLLRDIVDLGPVGTHHGNKRGQLGSFHRPPLDPPKAKLSRMS